MGGSGVLLAGPMFHLWYTTINRHLQGKVLRLLALDQLLFTPSYTPLCLGVIYTLEGQQPADTVDAVKKAYWPTVCASWAVWVPAQACNFAFIPSRFQVLYINCVGLLWSVCLATLSHATE